MKNILIARPKIQAKELVDFLEGVGCKTFVEEVFSVKKILPKEIPFDKESKILAIIVTSTNACLAIENYHLPKGLKVFTVGKKTAQKLKEFGFKNVTISSKNSAESLFEEIIRFFRQEEISSELGQILYFRGPVVSFDFKKELEKFSIVVNNILAYEIAESQNFSDNFLNFINKNRFDEVLFFSQNSARIFFKLIKKHKLIEYFRYSQLICFSDKIAKAVERHINRMGTRILKTSEIKTFSENIILKKFYE